MAVTQLSLLGMIPVELFQPVCERLAGAAHDGEAFRRETSVYRKGVAVMTDHGLVAEENVLYLGQLRTASHQRTAWTIQVLQKPEPARLSPHVLAQGSIETPIAEDEGADPHKFVSALGYSYGATTFARGVRFHRGPVLIEVSQYFQTADAPTPLDPSSYIVSLSTQFSNPRPPPPTQPGQPQAVQNQGPSAQELKAEATNRLNETKAVLRGLCDLARVDP